MYSLTTIEIINQEVSSTTVRFVEDANIILEIGKSVTRTSYPNDWTMRVLVCTRVS